MSDLRPAQLLCRLGLDAVVWYCVPSVFLFAYVNRYSVPIDAVLPHLHLVTLTLLSLALVRMVLYLVIPSQAGSRLAASIVTSTLLVVLFFYYGLVLIGLQSWGRVISWNLITSYSAQVLELADTLGISVPLAMSAIGLTYLGLLAVTWTYVKHFDWVPQLSRSMPAWLLAFLLLSGCVVLATERYNFLAAPWTREFEPVSLTFFPMQAARNLQDHAIDRLSSLNLDHMEDTARASYSPSSAPDRKNLILIVVDALRADHMGIYGYERDTTPNLSRLAHAGMTRKVSTVHASCSSSACGLLSLASSKFVHQFSNRPFILQEVLKRYGYRVHMILSGDHTSFYDLKSIYGQVDTYFDGYSARRFKYLNDDQLVLDKLGAFPSWDGVPVMIQLHLMSAHPLGNRHRTTIKYSPSANYVLPENHDPERAGHINERVANFYDNGVVQADENIHEILGILGRNGYLHNALVAITADHGESLGEHGLFQHTNSVREEVLRVPFLLVSYGYRPGQSIDSRISASQVDIAPTLLAELGMPRPATWSGAPLQQSVARDFTYFQEQSEVGLFDYRDPGNPWKYWVNSKTGEEYAFNLSLDPKESLNAISKVSPDQKREWRLKVLPGASVFFDRP